MYKQKSAPIYSLLEGVSKCEESQGMVVYGVSISDKENVAAVNDISCNKNEMEKLLCKLKRLEVSADFLGDVVEDFLFEHYCDFVIIQNKDRNNA
ncbi:MAG: DUF6514 family protein [Oscillospiraceae bacterium]